MHQKEYKLFQVISKAFAWPVKDGKLRRNETV
jgi:hypothetical protein